MTKHYGFQHRYGANVRDDSGDMVGTLFVFQSKPVRDAWVNGGNEYQNDRGARTVVTAKHAARFQRVSGAVETVA